MAKDKIYEKQLEQFGIEAVNVSAAEIKQKPPVSENRDAQNSVIRGLMDTVQGRQWLWEKMNLCQVFGFTFTQGKPDLTNYLHGARDVGLQLFHEINAIAPEQIHLRNQEATSRSMAGKAQTAAT